MNRPRKNARKPKPEGRLSQPIWQLPRKIADEMIEWICGGGTVTSFCDQDGMPGVSTMYAWIRRDAEFAVRYEDAKKIREETIADQLLDIADARFTEDPEDVQNRRLRIDTRVKLLGFWNPAKFGTKAQLAVGGVTLQVVTGVPDDQPLAIERNGEGEE